jgi:divalent metal cation (Fe/Co/Zn/Cd) transporter
MSRSDRPEASKAMRGIRAAQAGLLVNLALVVIKLVAGIMGHAYALIADAIESMADTASSIIVWRGVVIAERPADADHP